MQTCRQEAIPNDLARERNASLSFALRLCAWFYFPILKPYTLWYCQHHFSCWHTFCKWFASPVIPRVLKCGVWPLCFPFTRKGKQTPSLGSFPRLGLAPRGELVPPPWKVFMGKMRTSQSMRVVTRALLKTFQTQYDFICILYISCT